MVTANMESEVERYMALPYRVELIPDAGGGWVVSIPDLPGCLSQGDTVDEALEMIRDAQRAWIAVALEDGYAVPEPRPVGDDEQYSGKFVVRVPKDVHRELAREAARQGVSLNLYAATMLARSVGRVAPEERKRGRPRRIAVSPADFGLPVTLGETLPAMEESKTIDDARSIYGQVNSFFEANPRTTEWGVREIPHQSAVHLLADNIDHLKTGEARDRWRGWLMQIAKAPIASEGDRT